MGTLTPGATYIYERANGKVYARESGSAPNTRVEIGSSYEEPFYDSRTDDGRPLVDHIKEGQLWGNIHRAAKGNPALQKALEQCIILYKLTSDYEKRYGNRKT